VPFCFFRVESQKVRLFHASKQQFFKHYRTFYAQLIKSYSLIGYFSD
jgi:hypothetical protein